MVGTINIYHIYFGAFSTNTTYLMNYFATDISSSRWYKVLFAYCQVQNNFKACVQPGKAVFKGSWVYKPTAKGIAITDTDMKDALFSNIRSNGLPSDPANGIYVIMFRGDFSYAGWREYDKLGAFCSYHDLFRFSTGAGSVHLT